MSTVTVEPVTPLAAQDMPPTMGAAPPINEKFLESARVFADYAGLAAAALGGIGLLGWALGHEGLKSILSGHVSIKANTALALVLSGGSVRLLRGGGRRALIRCGQIFAALTLLLGALTMVEYAFAVNLHLDELLFREPAGAIGTASPGRMGLNTAVNFILLGLGLLLIRWPAARKRHIVDVLALTAAVISVLALLGYMFGARVLYGFAYYTQMSVPAALAFVFLSAGTLAAAADSGWASVLVSDGLGGFMLRRLLPLALIVAPLFGWVVATPEHRGWYDSPMGHAVFVLGLMVILSAVIVYNARDLNRIDARRRHTEEVLRHSRDQWELTFNCMTEGLSYHAPDFTVVGGNQAFHRLLGPNRLPGTKCYEMVHGTTCPPDYCPMQRTLASGRTESGEFLEPRLGRYLNVRTDPVKDTEGKIVRVVHVVQDVTARKQAEAESQRLAAVVESSDDAILSKDLQGNILSWNRAAERIYGYTAGDMLGKPVTLLSPPELQHEIGEMLRQIERGERVRSHESQRVRKDGTRIDVSLTLSPILDPGGKVIGSSTIARDISERRRAEREIAELLRREQQSRREVAQLNAELEERVRQRTAELEISNRELEAFSYSVSHDLRAPLRSIDGFSQILLEEYSDKLDAEGRAFLARVRGASRHMGQLIDALLQLSQVARSEMRQDRVDLTALVRTITDSLRQSAPHRRVEFRIAEDLRVTGDAHLLEVALHNLMSNAFKFTMRRDDAIIEFGSQLQDGETVYFLRDNGAGFDMSYAHKLFGAFQRLHALSEFEGSGIGLATVQRIIRRHHGRIWAESEPGKGATFYFTLSARKPPQKT